MSKLVYLITVWGGAQQYLLKVLQVQQLNAVRTVRGFFSRFWSKKPTRPSYLESQQVFMIQFPHSTHTEQGMLQVVGLDMGKCLEGSPL